MSAYRVLHSLPGRVRVRLPGWSGAAPRNIEREVCEIDGVRKANANPHTRNLLVHFDPGRIDDRTLLAALERKHLGTATPANEHTDRALAIGRAARGFVREVGTLRRRVRIPLPGLDRNPALAQRAVERLSRLPGVARVTVSQLTGRMLIEYSEHLIDIEDLLAELTKLDLPDIPGEDLPAHPLDPAPLIESTARSIGAGLGLGWLALRRALGAVEPPPGAHRGAQVAGALGIIDGLPPVAERLEEVFGHDATQAAISGLSIVSLTLADSLLGLAVSAAGAARLMSTVRARRERWNRYEERAAETGRANPGARALIAAGQRVPLAATVVSGGGTALCRTGALLATTPGAELDAGTLIVDGAVTVRLSGEPEFSPQPRQAPPTPTTYDRYLQALPVASLGYALGLGITSRSFARISAGLLLVNPRAALIGAANADNAAAARALSAGITVVGSRARRPIVTPDVLVIESARALVDAARPGQAPRAAPGLPTLLAACHRHGVRVELAAEHAREIGALAAKHELPATDVDALVRIRELQAQGAVVAALSDGAHAGHEFAECDLAIGLTNPREGPFAGRADILVPDLESVATLVEIGARRDAAVSDGVLASTLANLVGAGWGLAGDPGFARASQATYVAALAALADGHLRLRGGRSGGEMRSDRRVPAAAHLNQVR